MLIVVVTGIVAFVKNRVQRDPFPTTYFIIWVIVSLILIGITVVSWLYL
jgi:hypothetical protein